MVGHTKRAVFLLGFLLVFPLQRFGKLAAGLGTHVWGCQLPWMSMDTSLSLRSEQYGFA